MRRFDMQIPALVKCGTGEELATETENVSARGVFFFIDRPVEEGERLEITLTFPAQVMVSNRVRVRFTAQVVRVERGGERGVGIGAAIEHYEFLRAQPADALAIEKASTQ